MTHSAGAVVPPQSEQAEQALLGALLLDNSMFDACGNVVLSEHFYWPEHRAIFGTIARLVMSNKPADVVTVHEAGGHELVTLNALASATLVANARNVARYADIVATHWRRRELQRIAMELIDAAGRFDAEAPSVADSVDKAAGAMLALMSGRHRQEPEHVEQAVVAFIDQMNAMAEGNSPAIGTGLIDLDEATAGGGRPGDLWVLGARPSMGKSAFVETISLNVSEKRGVLVLSQEDSAVSWVSRAVANLGQVNLADLRNPLRARDPDAMWHGVGVGVDALPKRNLYLDDQGGLSLMDVRRKVQQAQRKMRGELGLVVVDYLQLMTGEGDNRNQMLGHVANGMKALAKEMKVWIVLLSQLSRKADETTGLPQMAHLRDSGDIEGAADTIALLHREAQRKRTEENKNWAQLHIVKQKNGPTCTVNLWFDGAHQRFGNWAGQVPSGGGRSASRASGSGLE